MLRDDATGKGRIRAPESGSHGLCSPPVRFAQALLGTAPREYFDSFASKRVLFLASEGSPRRDGSRADAAGPVVRWPVRGWTVAWLWWTFQVALACTTSDEVMG